MKPGDPAPSTPVTIVFVTSSSRSGSTLLDILLGSVDGCLSTGELRHIWIRGLQQDWVCGCGKRFSQCEFWTEVLRSAFGKLDRNEVERIVGLQRDLERTRNIVESRFDGDRPLSPPALEYREILRALYEAAQRVSGCNVIVDSSKLASHGYLVDRMVRDSGRHAFHSIHLIRDSRAVAYSWYKLLKEPGATDLPELDVIRSFKFSRGWVGSNLTSHILNHKVERATTMYYEELSADPARVFSNFLVEAGLAESGSLPRLDAKPGSHHTVSGNPMRMSDKPLEIRPDLAWKTSLPRSIRWGVTALTWPLLLRYGYLGKG
jgi:Sulfotransferase family